MTTHQEIFDGVAKHLLTQNAKALGDTPDDSCRYRAKDGRKCGIGGIMPDAAYSEALEGAPIDILVGIAVRSGPRERTPRDKAARAPGFKAWINSLLGATDAANKSNTVYLLNDLQRVHDAWPPHQWPTELERVARNHNISAQIIHDTLNARQADGSRS